MSASPVRARPGRRESRRRDDGSRLLRGRPGPGRKQESSGRRPDRDGKTRRRGRECGGGDPPAWGGGGARRNRRLPALANRAGAVSAHCGRCLREPRRCQFEAAWAAGRAPPAEQAVAEAGEMLADMWRRPRPVPRQATFGLTPRESRSLTLLTEGSSNQAIADTLFLSPLTVKNHVASIFPNSASARVPRRLPSPCVTVSPDNHPPFPFQWNSVTTDSGARNEPYGSCAAGCRAAG